MILVDTNVWIDHLRKGDPGLIRLLDDRMVVMHPWVRGELALGSIQRRQEFLGLLACLPQIQPVTGERQLACIEQYRWWGRGIGWVDAQLLAACLDYPCRLLTRDVRLAAVAQELGVGFAPLV